MLEFFAKLQHWFFIPNYIKVAERELATAQLRLRQEQAAAHYSSLMIQYWSEAITRDEALLLTVKASQLVVAKPQVDAVGHS